VVSRPAGRSVWDRGTDGGRARRHSGGTGAGGEHERALLRSGIYRRKGELLLKHGGPDWAAEAETCFRQALDIARAQSAKSWELRAATSLARLWTDQGKRAQAHDLLGPVYDWFTEGFETADLKEAKALLDELA
jgi:predicted ATPase